MTRVIAGVAGGRRLVVPSGRGGRDTRPTSDRAREALFSTLEALRGPLHGARALDLYAGSGAVGLEALSRGAEHALLVESGAGALRAVWQNVRDLGLPGAEVAAVPVERLVAQPPPGRPYDIVFLDPPYAVADSAVRKVASSLLRNGWLVPGALVVVERSNRGGELSWPAGFEPLRSRRYGEGVLWYGRAARHDAP